MPQLEISGIARANATQAKSITPTQECHLSSPRQPDTPLERWPPAGAISAPEWQTPGWPATIWRGARGKCPHCAAAPIFRSYLKVWANCQNCAAPLGDLPADDAPAWIALLVVLHLCAVALIVIFAVHYIPGVPSGIVLLSLLAAVCGGALRLAKGAVIAILFKLNMRREQLHG